MELEIKTQQDTTPTFESPIGSVLMMTPDIKEDYWAYRVKLIKDQSIIGFPKFTTIGIGFALESDWNTNLPYTCSAGAICDHIWHNRKYTEITRAMVVEAITLIQNHIKAESK
jgi:hypothetical protein